jgi:hypothetical protein
MPDNVAGWQVLGPPGCAGILAGSFWALGNFMVSAHRCSPASCGLDGPPPLAALWNVVMKLDVCLGCQNADYDGGLAGGQRGGPGAVAQRHDHHIGPARHFLVPPPEHNYHDRKSGVTEIYLRCVRPILIVNLMCRYNEGGNLACKLLWFAAALWTLAAMVLLGLEKETAEGASSGSGSMTC